MEEAPSTSELLEGGYDMDVDSSWLTPLPIREEHIRVTTGAVNESWKFLPGTKEAD